MESKTPVRNTDILLIVFISGACSLAYQVVWLRELKLIFGASTLANSAVLAAFMGGLGLGGAVLGRRCERSSKPLRFYSSVEFTISALAFLTPVFLFGARELYSAMGGSISMGATLSTVVRLSIAALVVGLPAFFMGGTLPALARSATQSDDENRGFVAKLYGINTLGAVFGATSTTFFTLEWFGQRQSLWFFALLNIGIALYARSLGRDAPQVIINTEKRVRTTSPLIWIGAFVTGFSFFALELVWYRLSAPLFGGSTYSFGIILIVALAGIGVGGYAQSKSATSPSSLGFALSNALAAMLCLIPFALGDDFARLANALRQVSGLGFVWLVGPWVALSGLLVFPTAVVAGYQFPLLLGLKGQGSDNVAADVGDVYAVNTVGAIVGAMVGGFWILPALGAANAWRICALSFAALAVLFMIKSALKSERSVSGLVVVASLIVGAFFLARAPGPDVYWRDSAIGAGRAVPIPKTRVKIETEKLSLRSHRYENHEGVEANITYRLGNSLALVTNGKSDGSVLGDAKTQVGLAFVGPMLHKDPKSAFVIGLGTGQTAGWIAEMPGIKRVLVAEIESAVVRFAKLAALSNFNVTEHPEVEIALTDGREALLASKETFDIIVSEPSNPYRAGLSSFYTHEFYRSASKKMNENGVFIQWIQGYEISAQTLASALATMRGVFSHVEAFSGVKSDLIIVANNGELASLEETKEHLAHPRAQDALRLWEGPLTAETFFSHRLCDSGCVDRYIKKEGAPINTDDHNHLDFAFARTVGEEISTDKDLESFVEISGLDNELLRKLHARKHWGKTRQVQWLNEYEEDAKLFLQRKSTRHEFSAAERNDIGIVRKLAFGEREDGEGLEMLALDMERLGAKEDASLARLNKALIDKEDFEVVYERSAAFVSQARVSPWLSQSTPYSLKQLLGRSKTWSQSQREKMAELFVEPFAARVFDRARILTGRALQSKSLPNESCLKFYRTPNSREPVAGVKYYIRMLKCVRNRDEGLSRKALDGLGTLKDATFSLSELNEITDEMLDGLNDAEEPVLPLQPEKLTEEGLVPSIETNESDAVENKNAPE